MKIEMKRVNVDILGTSEMKWKDEEYSGATITELTLVNTNLTHSIFVLLYAYYVYLSL
jgi:hypothetical protein